MDKPGYSVMTSQIDDPFRLYKWVRQFSRHTALLESRGEIDEDTARYTVIGASPSQSVSVRNDVSHLTDYTSGITQVIPDWRPVLAAWTASCNPHGPGSTNPVQTGVIGYIGYDARHFFDRFDQRRKPGSTVPDVFLVRYDVVFVHDRISNSSWWAHTQDRKDICDQLEVAYASNAPTTGSELAILGDPEFHFDKNDHLDGIRWTKQYIADGDIFQANITARFAARYQGDLFRLYERLRDTTPNPNFAYLDFDHPVLSTSPERFFRIRNGRIAAYPIKGTSRVTKNGHDQRHVLASSEKDRAENIMIADLTRNDIGRVCVQGSVQVEHLCRIRRFNRIYHLESVISGELKDNVGVVDVLAAMFPGGSIVGAPKVRAACVIDEIESTRRGPYCGTIGFFGTDGWVDTSIAIRTLYADGHNLYFHAGGGIVMDSDPGSEYDELLLKVSAIRSTLEEFNVLSELRQCINAIDDQVFRLLHQRFQAVLEVGERKRMHAIPYMQRSRVEQMIQERIQQSGGDTLLTEDFIRNFYDVLVGHAMRLERDNTTCPPDQTLSNGVDA